MPQHMRDTSSYGREDVSKNSQISHKSAPLERSIPPGVKDVKGVESASPGKHKPFDPARSRTSSGEGIRVRPTAPEALHNAPIPGPQEGGARQLKNPVRDEPTPWTIPDRVKNIFRSQAHMERIRGKREAVEQFNKAYDTMKSVHDSLHATVVAYTESQEQFSVRRDIISNTELHETSLQLQSNAEKLEQITTSDTTFPKDIESFFLQQDQKMNLAAFGMNDYIREKGDVSTNNKAILKDMLTKKNAAKTFYEQTLKHKYTNLNDLITDLRRMSIDMKDELHMREEREISILPVLAEKHQKLSVLKENSQPEKIKNIQALQETYKNYKKTFNENPALKSSTGIEKLKKMQNEVFNVEIRAVQSLHDGIAADVRPLQSTLDEVRTLRSQTRNENFSTQLRPLLERSETLLDTFSRLQTGCTIMKNDFEYLNSLVEIRIHRLGEPEI